MKWHDKNLHWMAISSKFQTIYLKILLTWFISHELLILCLNRCQSDLTNSNKTISFFHFLAIYFDSPCNSITVNIYKILFAIKATFTLMCYCPFKKKEGKRRGEGVGVEDQKRTHFSFWNKPNTLKLPVLTLKLHRMGEGRGLFLGGKLNTKIVIKISYLVRFI